MKRSCSIGSGGIGYYSRPVSTPAPDLRNLCSCDAARLEDELIQLRESTKQALKTSWDEVENLQSENSRLKDTIKIIDAELSKAKRELEESKSHEKDTNMKNEKLMQKLKSTKGSPLYKTIFTRRPSDEVQKRPKQSQVGLVPTIDEYSHYSISSDLDPISLLGDQDKGAIIFMPSMPEGSLDEDITIVDKFAGGVVLHEKSSTYGGPFVSSTSRSAGGRGKSQNIMVSRHQLVHPKEHHRHDQKDGRKSEQILASRHQLRRPNSEVKMTKTSSGSNLVRKTQNESMRSSYGSTGQTLKNLRNSSRSLTSASSSMNSNNEVKITKSSSGSILVQKTQNESIRSSYGSTGQILKNLRNSSRSFSTKRNVSFDKVSIREYPRCVGDNPSVTTGPPMSIEWDHQGSEEYTVNDYEGNRTPAKKVKKIKGQDRFNLLTFEWKASLDDILDADKETRIIRQQREETKMQNRIQQTRMRRHGGGLTLKKSCSTPALASLRMSIPRNDSFSLPKRSPVPTKDESSHYSISSDLDPISLLETRTKTRRRGGGLTLKKSCSSPALASLGIPRKDSFSLLKRLSVSGKSRLKKTHNSFINRSLHAMGRSTSSSSMLLLLSDDDDQQDRRSSKSLMEASMHSCPEPSSTRPRKVSVPVHQDLADFNIIEENAKKTGEERLLRVVTLNDINKSTVLVERNKAITVDSTEAKPAVDDKDLLIRTLEIKLLSRNETINSMEKTMLENIKNMQELHVAQINSMEKTTLENIKNMQELLVAQHGV